jgi:RNA polymerase sigma factor (sigma-70 family)
MIKALHSPDPAQSDAGLIAAARQGRQSAFAEILVRYRPRIYALAYRMTMDEDDALDITQEVSIRLCRNIGQLRCDAALWAWLRTATVNLCHSLFRRRGIERERLKTMGMDESRMDQDPSKGIVSIIERGQQVHRVEEALALLPKQQRTVFSLRFFEDLPLSEIAESMDLSVGAVKSHLFRATHKLRDMLVPKSGSGEEVCS